MAPLAGPSGPGANFEQAPQPAKTTRLVDAMGRWSAAVKIAGQETEIFKVEHQVGKTTCYIAAEEGKEFEVWLYHTMPPSTDESEWLYVDGTRCVPSFPRSARSLAHLLLPSQNGRLRQQAH